MKTRFFAIQLCVSRLWLLLGAIFGVFALSFPNLSWAVEVTELYEAEVPVTSQDVTQRQDAMRAAMAEVLVKVSGNRNIGTVPGMSDLVNTAPQFVQQFIYRNAPVPAGQRPTQPPARNLWVRFDRDVLNRVLRQKGVGIWGRGRPSLLLWLDLSEREEHVIVGTDNKPEWKQFIDVVAKTRGVPLLLPNLDADDFAALQTTDLWAATPDEVLRISARYQPEAVLLGRVQLEGFTWVSTWSLFDRENRETWSMQGESRDEVVLDGLQGAIDAIAARYTSASITEGGTTLQVNDVQSIEDYARVTKYLASLASVAQVQLLRVEGTSLVFRVEAQGGVQRLVDEFRLGKTLAAVQDGSANTTETDGLVRFRLVR